MESFLQFIFSGLTAGAAYALVALGFSIVYNGTEAVNFLQGEYVMLGGIIGGTLHEIFGWPLYIVVLLTILAGMAAGWLTELIGVRWMRNPSGDNITIATIGMAMALKATVMVATGRKTASLPPFSDAPPITIGGASLLPQTLWNIFIMILAAILLTAFFRYTKPGVIMRATADDRDASSMVGVNLTQATAWTFILAGGLGATAGVSLTPITLMSFEAGTLLGLKGFAAAMLGGIGGMYGSIAGGLLLGLAEALTAGYISSAYSDVVAFVVLLFVLLKSPTGLFGQSSTQRA